MRIVEAEKRKVAMIVRVDSGTENQSMTVVEHFGVRSRVRRRKILEVRRNIPVESWSRQKSDVEVKVVDLALEEVERRNQSNRENEDDNFEKENPRVDCS